MEVKAKDLRVVTICWRGEHSGFDQKVHEWLDKNSTVTVVSVSYSHYFNAAGIHHSVNIGYVEEAEVLTHNQGTI